MIKATILIILIVVCLFTGVALKVPEIDKLKKENTTLKFKNDSLQLRIARQKVFIQEHFKECALISRNQIKKVVNGRWITLKGPFDMTTENDWENLFVEKH